MKSNSLLSRWLLVCGSLALAALVPGLVSAQPFFSDGFESGDFLHSENGFRWGNPNATSIVRDDGYVVNNGSPVMNGPLLSRQWENGPESSGRHSMRFRYGAGASMSEQRFSLGNAHQELWVRYWLRVPINFQHGSDASNNNKLFAIWMDDYEYSGDGPTVVWQYRNDGSGGSVTKVYAVRSVPWDTNRHTGEQQSKPFISIPEDRGRWMQLVFRVVAATNEGAADGIIEMWRRWEGEGSFTKLHEISDAVIHAPVGGPGGWSAGYLMGWANSTYSSDTEFLLDDFVVSTTSLLEASTLPRPPSPVSVE